MNKKDFERMLKMAKANNINTLGELAMYCRVWNIGSNIELLVRLGDDYIEILHEKFEREVARLGNN